MATDTTVFALNELIETCKDSEEGFRTAADGLQDPTRSRALVEQQSAQVRTVHDRVRAMEKAVRR
jgi:hypothetical protein